MIEACINLSIGERTNPTDDHQLLASVIRIFSMWWTARNSELQQFGSYNSHDLFLLNEKKGITLFSIILDDQELSQKLNFEDVLPAVFEKQFVEHLETFHPNIPRPTIYRSLIDFLTGVSAVWLEINRHLIIVRKVKEILAKDEEIFRKFLSTSNVHRLKERLEKIYIGDHLDQISEQMKIFLREKNIQSRWTDVWPMRVSRHGIQCSCRSGALGFGDQSNVIH